MRLQAFHVFKSKVTQLSYLSMSVHESIDNGINIELPQVGILLSNTAENNWLARLMNHVDCCANFLIDCVKLGQHNTINGPWIGLIHCEVDQ